jgi:hypothetical protein
MTTKYFKALHAEERSRLPVTSAILELVVYPALYFLWKERSLDPLHATG